LQQGVEVVEGRSGLAPDRPEVDQGLFEVMALLEERPVALEQPGELLRREPGAQGEAPEQLVEVR
jgi:hypothetical protein